MFINVDLHLRVDPGEAHRNLGLVVIESDGPLVQPHHDIACCAGGRAVKAHVTSVRRRRDRLPHVYADTIDKA